MSEIQWKIETGHRGTDDPAVAADAWLLQLLREKTNWTERKTEPFSFGICDQNCWIAAASGTYLFETCYLDLIATDPGCRGKGLATALLRHLEQECLKRGVRRIFLSTQDFQAPGFYEKQGFECCGQMTDVPFAGTTRFFFMITLSE